MTNSGTSDAGNPDSETHAEVMSEVTEYLHVSQLRRRILPRAALVGVASGLMAIAFRSMLAWGDAARNGLIDWSHGFGATGLLFPVALGALGSALSVYLVRRFAPETAGSGIPHLEAVFHRYRDMRSNRVLPVKFIGGILALGSGLTLGREGPTVQMGGATGDLIARGLKAANQERITLMAAGAGAGLAAAFNAPLAGLVFVLEEVQRDFRPVVFAAAFVAAAIANILTQAVLGQKPVFTIPSYPLLPLLNLPTFAALGALTGLLGVAFNRGLLRMLEVFSRVPPSLAPALAGAVGALVGALAWFVPMAVGGGHPLSELTLANGVALAWVPLWFLVRFGLTVLCYATGAPGGIFAPLLVLGGLAGLGVGQAAHLINPGIAGEPGAFAVVGMAAYFTAIVRAPLTGVVLIVEMTGDYNQMLPLLVGCFAAYIVAERLGELPIYEALLERDLWRGGLQPWRRPVVRELEVESGAQFAGRRVRELGLPRGCLIVNVRDGTREWVPNAETRLLPHMRISVVIAPDAESALQQLRAGCKAGRAVVAAD